MINKPQILHICPDEKYIDGAIYLFEKAFPGNNLFIIASAYRGAGYRYVSTKDSPTRKVYVNQDTSVELLKDLEKYDVILLHALNSLTSHLVNKSNEKFRFMWVMMGAEVYQNPLVYSKPILGDSTRALKETTIKKTNIIEQLKKYYRKLRYNYIEDYSNVNNDIVKAMSEVDSFASLIMEEFEFLTEKGFLSSKAKYQYYTYYPIEYFGSLTKKSICTEGNILIGNSSSYSNNHLEVFEKLKRLYISGRSIIAPLSYGDMNYKKALIPYGRTMFGKQFKPIIDLLPLEEYNNLLSSCGIVIMNHYRQQAVGNILMALWQGSKVYLSDLNILYKFFLRIGCRVYSVEKDLVPENMEALQLLDADSIEQNRKALKMHISEKVLVDKLKQGFKEYYNID